MNLLANSPIVGVIGFSIETEVGNFIWKDSDYRGDNTITLYKGDYRSFLEESGVSFGRSKGQYNQAILRYKIYIYCIKRGIIMRIEFRTNLDINTYEKWPKLNHVPQIGSYLQSNTGLELKVVSIRYICDKNFLHDQVGTVCFVELHLPPFWENISAFTKWYTNRQVKLLW